MTNITVRLVGGPAHDRRTAVDIRSEYVEVMSPDQDACTFHGPDSPAPERLTYTTHRYRIRPTVRDGYKAYIGVYVP